MGTSLAVLPKSQSPLVRHPVSLSVNYTLIPQRWLLIAKARKNKEKRNAAKERRKKAIEDSKKRMAELEKMVRELQLKDNQQNSNDTAMIVERAN
jgi:hypothetical protein